MMLIGETLLIFVMLIDDERMIDVTLLTIICDCHQGEDDFIVFVKMRR